METATRRLLVDAMSMLLRVVRASSDLGRAGVGVAHILAMGFLSTHKLVRNDLALVRRPDNASKLEGANWPVELLALLFFWADGITTGRLRGNLDGVLVSTEATGKELYDSTHWWRERAMIGAPASYPGAGRGQPNRPP